MINMKRMELGAQEALRRIRDLLDVDVQYQFDWKACDEEQYRFAKKKKTMINLWFAGTVPKEERFRSMNTVRKVLETKAHKKEKRGHEGWDRAEPQASGDPKGSGTFLRPGRATRRVD